MQTRNLLSYLLVAVLASGCVTKIISSDGSVQGVPVDKDKLSDTYVNLAIEYQKHGAPQVALDRLNLAIDTNSSNYRAYMVRGLIYNELNKPDLAEADFQKSLSINKSSSETYVSYASFLCDKKRYDDAMKNYALALDNPLYFTPEIGYLSRAKCEYKMNDFTSANSDLMRSLTYKNIPQDSYILLAQIQYQQNNFVVAKYYIDKYAGTQTPATLWLHIQILQALLDVGANANQVREYTSYRNTLARVLLDDYSNSQEAQSCLIKYGQPSSTSSIPTINANPAIATTKPQIPANIQKIETKTTPLPDHSVSTSVQGLNTTDNDKGDAVIVDNSDGNSPVTAAISSNGVQISPSGRRYVIMPANVTLYTLAKQYGLTVAEIQKYNKIKTVRVKPGLVVFLDPVGVNQNARTSTPQVNNSNVAPAVNSLDSTNNTNDTNSDNLIATITGGDSITTAQVQNGSANKVVVTKPSIINNAVVNNTASVISANALDNVVVATDGDGRRYLIVPPKTTAFSISKKFNLTVKQLEQYNRMKSSQVVSGMKLYLDPAK